MSLAAKLLSASGGMDKLYVDDVFSAYTYTGNGSTQTINNGIDLAGKGGLVWAKSRANAASNLLWDTSRGALKYLLSDSAAGEATVAEGVNSFNSNGFGLTGSSLYYGNGTGATYTSWTFRKAPKFFDIVTYTGNNVAGRQIPHSLGVLPGMIIVKDTSGAGAWRVYHRGMTSPAYAMSLNTTSAQSVDNSAWNSTAPTATHFTLGGDLAVNSTPETYVAYLFAHDTSAEGIVQCGSFTTDGSGNATVNLGWEPQYLMFKASSSASDWWIEDSMRGMPVTSSGVGQAKLVANASAAETISSLMSPTATGISTNGVAFAANTTYAYIVIRRPNKPPTTGTQVYNAIARTGTGAAATVTGVGFAPDLVWLRGYRGGSVAPASIDRLRGSLTYLLQSSTAAEASTASTQGVTAFTMDGISIGTSVSPPSNNATSQPEINHFFKRAPGVFDVVCYTGTGVAKTEAHSLGVVPELMIVKSRSAAGNWPVLSKDLGAPKCLILESTAAAGTISNVWNDTAPTPTVFTVGTNSETNTAARTYVAYLFASLQGISKCGSYTGNGGTQTINCGFATGARFFLVKATSTTGSWWIFDSARGIISAADPALQINSTAAEITSADAVDPHASGLIINQEATCSINASGVSYIYLALS